ncbi:MAG: AAA family ATPase [Burkholderiales bacterium]
MKPWLGVDEALHAGYGDNPLFAPLGPRLDADGLGARLWQEPLTQIPWRRVSPAERDEFLPLVKDHFIPTPDTLAVATAFQGLLRQHYLRRNPCLSTVRARAGALAAHRGERLQTLPWFNGGANGMSITGITGLGKSVTVERLLSLYPQTFEHEPRPDAGWAKFRQLVWLRVQMSSDSSRAGFLMQILSQVDAALGTDYAEQYGNKRKWTVEKLMVVVGIVLTTHCCGALVIEELQERNFPEGPSRDLLLLFFLRLLNFGVPIVLIGNPLAFQAFDDHSQDVRRLYAAGCFELWPADTYDDAGWTDFFLPGLAKFNLLGREFEWTPELRKVALANTGGVTGFMATYWASIQQNALLANRDHVSPEDFLPAAAVPELRKQGRLINALAARDVTQLSAMKDVPCEAFADRWDEQRKRKADQEVQTGVDGDQAQAIPTAPRAPRYKRVESHAKSQKTRKANRSRSASPTLAADDLRRGTQAALQAGFRAMRQEHEADDEAPAAAASVDKLPKAA